MMTYNSLVSQVQLTFERSDAPFLGLIPSFIEQAHQRISRDANSLEMTLYVQGTFTSGNNKLTKPSNWRRPLALKVILAGTPDTYQVVEWRTYEFCRSYFPANGNIAGQLTTPATFSPVPLFYCDYGREHLMLSPTPIAAYPFELAFYGVVPTITSNLQTNYLTEYAPTLLLYATLLEACTFLKNDERIPVWVATYASALEELNEMNKFGKEDRQTDSEKD